MDDPAFSRVFVVCGKAAEADTLTAAFSQYGKIQSIKLIREKGVAYIKYNKASAAALAIEHLHEAVLNEGRGPTLKVMLAEAPHARRGGPQRPMSDTDVLPDPDNLPLRSRLFLVVPKTADAAAIEQKMAATRDLQYCKTDLIASKGIVFCKYSKASSALIALEEIAETGTLAGYKVKCMLAEPKSKGHREAQPSAELHTAHLYQGMDALAPSSPLIGAMRYSQQPPRQYDPSGHQLGPPYSPMSPRMPLGSPRQLPYGSYPHPHAAEAAPHHPPSPYSHYSSPGRAGPSHDVGMLSDVQLNALAALQNAYPQGMQAGVGGLPVYPAISAQGGMHMPPDEVALMQSPIGPMPGMAGSPMMAPMPQHLASPLPVPGSETRLYVGAGKGVGEAALRHLFASIPGMLSCELQLDRTGHSRGVAYVVYASQDAALAAVSHFNEYDLGQEGRLKVHLADAPQGPPPGHGDTPGTPRGSQLSDESVLAPGHGPATPRTPRTPRYATHLYERQEHPSPGMSTTPQSRYLAGSEESPQTGSQQASIASMEASLASMYLSPGAEPRASWPGRQQPAVSPESDASIQGTMQPSPRQGAADPNIAYAVLARAMPDYALSYEFSRFGTVEWVSLQQDPRCAWVRMSKPEETAAAVRGLHNTELCGQALSVYSDPFAAGHGTPTGSL